MENDQPIITQTLVPIDSNVIEKSQSILQSALDVSFDLLLTFLKIGFSDELRKSICRCI